MTDSTADQIRRLHGIGVDGAPVEFAKGGIIPPDSDALDQIRYICGFDSRSTPIVQLVPGYGDVIEHADDVIAIGTWVLSQQPDSGIVTPINNDGNLVCDTAGEYVYRPVRFAEQGRVVVCERVR